MQFSKWLGVRGGDGGNGCISFIRRRFVPRGGPSGGNGGDGGDVYVVARSGISGLQHLTGVTQVVASRGGHGGGNGKQGRRGASRDIVVPLGTLVKVMRGGNEVVLLADLTAEENRVLVARGGRGGKGNAHFASPVNQEPLLAEAGMPGQSHAIQLEVVLQADIGIIGQPNAGKSSLLRTLSAARPRVAAYPYTTTTPVIGAVETLRYLLVLVELPGLVDGAHDGRGLGNGFLRQAERTRMLLHMLDGCSSELAEDYHSVNRELRLYSQSLAEKPQLVVVNKADLPEVRQQQDQIERELREAGCSPLFISTVTREGVDLLVSRLTALVASAPVAQSLALPPQDDTAPEEDAAEPPWVWREGDVFVVSSPEAESLVSLVDLRDTRVQVQLWHELERRGLVVALERAGARAGDTVRIGAVELEWR